MKIFRLFYDSLFYYPKTIYAYHMRLGARMLYLLLLSLIMVVPILPRISNVMDTWDTNRHAIISSIPEFETSGETIQSNTQPFVNQTDFITYTFDPEDHIDQTNIAPSDSAVVAFKTGQQAFSVSVMDQEVMRFPYDGREAGTDVQKDFISRATSLPRPAVYVAVYISSSTSILFNALMLSILFGFMRLARELQLPFGRKFNFTLAAMTMPTVFSSLIALAIPAFTVSQSMIIFFMGWLLLFYISSNTRVIPLDKDNWMNNKRNDK